MTATCSNGTLNECGGNVSINANYSDPDDPTTAVAGSGLDEVNYSESSGVCTGSKTGLNGTPSYSLPDAEPNPCVVTNDGSGVSRTITAYGYDIAGNGYSIVPITYQFIGPWYKLKNTSFHKYNVLSNYIPSTVNAFDGTDTTDRYLVIGNAGVVTSDTTIDLNGAQATTSDWNKENSTRTVTFTRDSFLSYVQSKKNYTTISDSGAADMDDLNGAIDENGIYIWGGTNLDFSSVPAALNTKEVIIIVNGTATISVANFNPAESVAIVAESMVFSNATTNANGIFYGDTVSFGTGNNPLKITGNVNSAATTNAPGRERTDDRFMPSLFIVFNTEIFIDLLPYLSNTSYSWTQLQ